MSKEYENIKEITKNIRSDYQAFIFSYIFDIGYQSAKEITDEDIQKSEGNGIMTKDFCQYIMEKARELCNAVDSAVSLVQYCMVEDTFDIRNYADKLPRYKLEDMVKASLSPSSIMDVSCSLYSKESVENVCDRYNCDAEDLELLGFKIPDSYWED